MEELPASHRETGKPHQLHVPPTELHCNSVCTSQWLVAIYRFHTHTISPKSHRGQCCTPLRTKHEYLALDRSSECSPIVWHHLVTLHNEPSKRPEFVLLIPVYNSEKNNTIAKILLNIACITFSSKFRNMKLLAISK